VRNLTVTAFESDATHVSFAAGGLELAPPTASTTLIVRQPRSRRVPAGCAPITQHYELEPVPQAGATTVNRSTTPFERRATVAFICFDLSNDHSFHQLGQWYEAVTKNCAENVCLFLVGCKCDVNAVVPADEIQKFCERATLSTGRHRQRARLDYQTL
jgi:GTPase SAR1 family protein